MSYQHPRSLPDTCKQYNFLKAQIHYSVALRAPQLCDLRERTLRLKESRHDVDVCNVGQTCNITKIGNIIIQFEVILIEFIGLRICCSTITKIAI